MHLLKRCTNSFSLMDFSHHGLDALQDICFEHALHVHSWILKFVSFAPMHRPGTSSLFSFLFFFPLFHMLLLR